MSLTREEVKEHRQMLVFGPLLGAAVYGMMRLLASQPGFASPGTGHLPFVGSTRGWPGFLQSFWPLDIAVASACCYWCLRLCLGMLKASSISPEVRQGKVRPMSKPRLIVSGCTCIGLFTGVMCVAFFGWLGGLYMVLFGATVVAGFLALLAAVVIAFVTLVEWLLRKSVWSVAHAWQWLCASPLGIPFARIQAFFQATDVTNGEENH